METNQVEPRKTKGWWSFILGLLGFAFGGPFTGIPAIILGRKQMKEYPCWQANVGRILGIITTVLGIGFGIFLLFLLPGEERPPIPISHGVPKVIIEDYHIGIDNVEVDKVHLGESVVTLKNEGNAPARITKVILTSDGEEIEKSTFATLEAEEDYELSCDYGYGDEFSKDIGIEQIAATIKIFGHTKGENAEEQMLAEKSVIIAIPVIKIGDTIQEIRSPTYGTHNLSLTLLWWKESDIAVMRQSKNEYYTFKAKSGMKFIILAYEFKNNWIREQETPYISVGEIATDKGLIYGEVSGGIASLENEGYTARSSTKKEIDELIADSGGFEELLPGESIIGRIVFEIPENQNPVEANIAYVLPLIVF